MQILLGTLLSLHYTIAQTCRIETDSGTFDLSKISGRSYHVDDPVSPQYSYEFSFCSNVVDTTKCASSKGLISAVQYRNIIPIAECFKLGTWDQSYVPGGIKTTFTGFEIKFQNGDSDDFCMMNRSVIYNFECSSAEVGALTVSEPNICEYEVTVPTRYACAGNAQTCRFETDNGTFDLSKISGRKYHVDDPVSPYPSYDFSFCSNVVDSSMCPSPKGLMSAVQYTFYHVCYKLGTWDQSYMPGGIKTTFAGFQIKFQNGDSDFCMMNRSVIYNFECSSAEVGALTVLSEPNMCEYEVNVPTRYACAGNENLRKW